MGYNRDFLNQAGAKLIARWLIEVSLKRDTLTYGEVGKRLSETLNIGRVFSTHPGSIAGHMMDMIQEHYPRAPLINVLLVRRASNLPGSGAGYYLAKRYKDSRLAQANAPKKFRNPWRDRVQKAIEEVYAYSDWPHVYETVFHEPYLPDSHSPYKQRTMKKNETDRAKAKSTKL